LVKITTNKKGVCPSILVCFSFRSYHCFSYLMWRSDRRVIKITSLFMVGESLFFLFFSINLYISPFNKSSLDQCRAHKSISTPSKFVLSTSSLLYFTLFFYVLMINHVCVHSLFSLSMTRTYIQSIIHTYNERKREKESARNSRKWEGLIKSVCSRRRRCWMAFPHMDSIYRQTQERDNDWHLSHMRYVMKITQMICRRHTQVLMKKCTHT
jgi:hypothetical protein